MNNTIFHTLIFLLCFQSTLLRPSESFLTTQNHLLRAKEQAMRSMVAELGAFAKLDAKIISICCDGTVEQIRGFLEYYGAQRSTYFPEKGAVPKKIYPAHLAALAGNFPVMKEFIRQGFPVTNEKLLAMASVFWQLPTLRYLISQCADHPEHISKTPLVVLAVSGVIKTITQMMITMQLQEELASEAEDEVKKVATSESSLAKAGIFDCIELLVVTGADIDFRNPATGKTKIFECLRDIKICGIDSILFLKRFLALGLDPNIRCEENGNTLLHAAVMQRDSEAIKVLLASGTDPQQVNNEGLTPLECVAVGPSEIDCLVALLEGGTSFSLPKQKDRLHRPEYLNLLQQFADGPETRKLQDLKRICRASYVLFLPTHEEVETARKELLHLVWCFNKLDDDKGYSGLKMPYQKRDFMLAHSSLRNQLIRLYLVRLRNTNPHGVPFFTGIEKDAAEYLYDQIYDLYYNPAAPLKFSTNLTKEEFRDFTLKHIVDALHIRSQALKDRERKKVSAGSLAQG